MMQRNVERSTITFNAAISACGLGNKALQLFSTMGQSRIELDPITFHAAISAFETLQQGLASVLNDMRLYHLRLRLRKPPSNRQTYHITCNERQYDETPHNSRHLLHIYLWALTFKTPLRPMILGTFGKFISGHHWAT